MVCGRLAAMRSLVGRNSVVQITSNSVQREVRTTDHRPSHLEGYIRPRPPWGITRSVQRRRCVVVLAAFREDCCSVICMAAQWFGLSRQTKVETFLRKPYNTRRRWGFLHIWKITSMLWQEELLDSSWNSHFKSRWSQRRRYALVFDKVSEKYELFGNCIEIDVKLVQRDFITIMNNVHDCRIV